MAKKKKQKAKTCNICGLLEPHTRDAKIYECVGHNGVKSYLWNLHPENRGK
jgi:hypothetical protein